jgi:hypothetical protein
MTTADAAYTDGQVAADLMLCKPTDPNAPTIAADESAAEAFARSYESPNRRVLVLDEDGNLLGLLCLNVGRTRFCQTTTRH